VQRKKWEAEPVQLAQYGVARQHQQADEKQIPGLEQESTVHESEVGIYRTKRNQAVAVTELNPIQMLHIVVSRVRTGEICLSLAWSSLSRGCSLLPRNVNQRWTRPSRRMIPALTATRMEYTDAVQAQFVEPNPMTRDQLRR
jgi:hypothetical protein